MGADGTIQYVSREEWLKNCPGISCADIGLYDKEIAGTWIVAGYYDTTGLDWGEYGKQNLAAKAELRRHRIELVNEKGINGVYERKSKGMYSPHIIIYKAEEEQKLNAILNSPDYTHSVKCLKAQEWFQANCENWTVWT